MKRVISIIILIVLVSGMISGGGGNSGEDVISGDANNSASGIISTQKVNFIDSNGESVYRIVRPEGDSTTTAMSSQIYRTINSVLGIKIKNVLDSEDGTDAYEILIGDTNRNETAKAKEYMLSNGGGRFNDWIICTIGKKIVIYSQNTEYLQTACDYFNNNYIKAEGIEGGICYFIKAEGDFMDIKINGTNIAYFSIVKPHYNMSYLTKMEIDAFNEQIFQKTGYKLLVLEDAYTTEGDYEIVVGNTNRKDVETIENHDEYRIKISGKKIYLNGGSPHATAMSVTEFSKLISSGEITDSVSTVGNYSKTISTYDSSKYYVHKWGDDFDGDSVDTTKWKLITEEHYGTGPDGLSGQNGKQALRVPEANVVKDGCLYQLQYYDDKAYYGGTIRTTKLMKYMGGYLEHSVKLPDNPSSWNTLWLNSPESNGVIGPEVDLNENFGDPNVAHFNLHTWPTENNVYGWEHRSFDGLKPNEKRYRLPAEDGENLNTGFHTYGFLWREDYIAFIGDGEIYVDISLNDPGFEDFKMAFTTVACQVIIAASPGVGRGPKDTSTEENWTHEKSDYVTDYVHIYQLDDGWSRMEFNY